MSQDTHELSTNPDLSSQSSFCFHSPMTKKVKGKGSWPCRKTARITPHQKAMLIDQYFFHHKKIKEVLFFLLYSFNFISKGGQRT
jgi:hypothetical protein